jgi:hypothetical protein
MRQRDLMKLARCFSTDKETSHGYLGRYERHLSARRRERLTILEIGIGGGPSTKGGDSLRMWQAYFPNSMIYGIDIRPKSITGPRIRFLQGDQSDTQFLTRAAAEIGAIDVVIDDGRHVNSHVRTTFRTLFPSVAPGGSYIIEDLQTAYFAEFGGFPPGVNTPETSIGMVKELLDGLNHRHFRLPDYAPTPTDTTVDAVHAYEKIVFIEKSGGSSP